MFANSFHPAYQIINTKFLGEDITQTAGEYYEPKVLLAAYGLGTLTTSLCISSVNLSFNVPVSSLVAQAYGQKNPILAGIYVNRQIWMNFVFFIPIMVLMSLFSESIYLLIGVDETISRLAQEYVILTIPGFILCCAFVCYSRYMVA